ncbi:1-deoxy-D-xylulose-5-phosphate synthase [Streptomyces sp. CB02923]|uniref:1-deoxy-D-xylulose-5-phosphate synthase n=1 Tax=Streptomyces sp. CB02923 TaxID=1718985 RepID=UPI000938BC7F|nr:1-deoxy-D-xylulose-5-phosphate synthase [Streptomyces sp. CB02923]
MSSPRGDYPLLAEITGPKALRALPEGMLSDLAREIRAFLVDKVAASGGHLGPNLGVVELTLALHRVFESPQDTLLFDIGHQGYVHKLVTGRADGFDRLRQAGGLSGYLSGVESEHDVIENSHASTVLAYADGLARARELTGESDRAVVAVIGDGALTGGMAWEALNNLGGAERPVVVVLNDNSRSYAPTVGGLADHLRRLRERAHDGWHLELGDLAGDDLAAAEAAPNIFTSLGFVYLGPVDGHDRESLEQALSVAHGLGAPVVVHAVTRKGKGYEPAEREPNDRMHTCGVIDPATGSTAKKVSAPSWTSVFGEELCVLGRRRRDVVALTAAMPGPTGLAPFRDAFPSRFFDVGIAEQHAVTCAAGLATGGLHPVVALYATFLTRAMDQVLMDVALHRLPVTFVLDRAGITGPDGPSHHGMWDLTLLGAVPGVRIAAPRDAGQLAELLGEALAEQAGPTALRFPKGQVGPDVPAIERTGPVDVLYRRGRRDVLLVVSGPLAREAVEAAVRLAALDIGVTVADPRWVLPVPGELTRLAAGHQLVVTVEDNIRRGGLGTAIAQALADSGCSLPVRTLGLPSRFLPHAARGELLARSGLDARGLAQSVLAARAGHPLDDGDGGL